MIDIKHTEDGDIDLSSGDIRMVDSAQQHQKDILLAAQGDYKEFPEIGADSIRYIHDNDPTVYLRNVRKHFTKDGMKVTYVDYQGGELIIDAVYEND